jgi:hypothetical protein
MTTATVDRPTPTTEMGRKEAESITQAIKDNFGSLGSMLVQARDKKAYKALGYRSFETYCKTEFGKSITSAYRLIEDAKVVAQLEAEISKRYDEPIALNIPSACLRPLKELPDVDQKLRAIDYAKKLATAEGKKLATKKHLEIAVFEISGKRSKDFKKAIQSLGFAKGVAVEATKTLEKNRGIIKRIDNSGEIYVQLYNGGVNSIAFDADELRILTDAEKPARELNEITASKGDRVLIFARGLEGKKGTIYTWKEGSQALVTVDGGSSPVNIAYAEMELVRHEQEESNWGSELVWESGKNRYYYFPQEDTIYSDKWPQGLALKPHSHQQSPIEFIKNWEDKFAGSLLETLTTPARLKTLALAQAIELPENEGKEFAADLIASLSQLFPQPKAMGISFSRTIDELISGKKTQTRRAWQIDYAKNFIRYFDENIAIPALNKGRHRGGHELGFIKLTQRPYQQYLSEMSLTDLQAEGGMVSTAQEFIETYFEGQDKLVWVLHFEFLATPNTNNTGILLAENQQLREQLAEAEAAIQAIVNTASAISPLASAENNDFLVGNTAEISTPGDTAAHTDFLVGNTAEISTPGDTAAHTDFLVGNTAEISTPGDTAAHTDFLVRNTAEISTPGDTAAHTDFLVGNTGSWREILRTNHFIPVAFNLDGMFKGNWRGWDYFFHSPNGGVVAIDLANNKKEMFTRCTEHNFDIDLGDEDEIRKWLKNIINQVEDFCPGQLSLELNPEVESFPQALLMAIATEEEKIHTIIDKKEYQLQSAKLTKKEIAAISANNLQRLNNSLQELRDFQKLRIGQIVSKRFHPETKGKITGFELSVGGMPLIWVSWLREEGENLQSAEHYPLKSIVVES